MRKKLVRLSKVEKEKIKDMYLNYNEWPKIQQFFDISKATYHNIIRPLIEDRKNLHIQRIRNRLENADHTKLGWIAGIVDGEGHIGMASRYRKRDNSYWMSVKLEITSTTPVMQETLYELIGTGNLRNRKRYNVKHKDAVEFYVWRVESIYAILSVIAPLLVVKKQQAELALEWSKRRLAGEKYSPADMECFNLIRSLNKRGKDALIVAH